MQKLKKLLTNRDELLELARYIVAGVLTTVLSLIVSYGCYILLSENHTINGANTLQLMIGNGVSWVVAVIFAFWINRRMVFRVQGGTAGSKGREFVEFIAARAASWALLEEGVAALIKLMGVSNTWNRLIVLVLVTVFNYVASKFWIFKPKTAATADDSAKREQNPES
ncbi:MAG TPA: GtrA family protein [Candidatus Limiplasma sp.]|nr:GtrA family protein [Candidatus Limiplasma sp.]HPS81862.1 GtrA family protein [Candidatus Limiplasma sp.]